MSLTLAEARARAAVVSDVAYEIDLDLREPEQGAFGLRTAVRFTASGAETFLELSGATDLRVALDGVEVPPADHAYDGARISLRRLGGAHEVVVEARVPYVTDGDGMHTFTDPADGATYVSAYVGMDIAQKVFACFDQNDLKAPVSLRVTAPPEWTVLGNGRCVSRVAGDGAWEFAPTLPIPPAMFVVCAGPWYSHTWEHAGLPFGWHARRSLAVELDRDIEELRATTERCFDHYAELFDEPMPFDSYDQVMAPGQNWGALETPGCVTYRDEYLPRGHLTDRLRARRATTIAHEMAHMWFGDLVTMTWWEDTWLQESFADYMGYRVAEDAAGYPDLRVEFETVRKVKAYVSDAHRSTHPVAPRAEDVPDVDAASTNFDMISYAKGHSALRQLVVWLGDDTFLAGVNAYLRRHRLGNATLADFVTALDEQTASAQPRRDVVGWAEAWLRTTGYDTLRVERDADGVPVLHREGSRPHRVSVTAYDDALAPVEVAWVDVGTDPVRLDALAGRVVLPNATSETYARLALDPQSRAAFLARLPELGSPLARAVLWGALFADVEARDLPALEFVDAVARHLPAETEASLVSAVLVRTVERVVPLRVEPAQVHAVYESIAHAGAAGCERAEEADLRLAFLDAVVATTHDAELLRGWLAAGEAFGQSLFPGLRWRMVARLAAIGGADAAFVEAERLADGTVDGDLGAARALAARPSTEAKEEAWAVASEPQVSNRLFEATMRGLWQPEQSELLAPFVTRYLDDAPGWAAARGTAFAQRIGDAFPALPLTTSQVDELAARLSGDVPPVLRRDWEDVKDDLAAGGDAGAHGVAGSD